MEETDSNERLRESASEEPMEICETATPVVERERPPRRPLVSRALIAVALGGAALVALVIALVTWYFTGIGLVVPDVVGLQEGVARTRLAQSGLGVSTVERRFDIEPEGTILSQSPGEGSRLPRGGTVGLVVSAGTEEFIMPDVTGVGINVARAQLEQSGLVVRIEAVESDQPSDMVIETIPAPGSLVRTSDIVRVRVASEGIALDVLLPFALEGRVFVIDPLPAPGADIDPALEVSRRLRSLLEASRAQVIVTRSITETDVPVATRAQRATASEAVVTAVVGLDVVADAPTGLGVLTPTMGSLPETQVRASEGLADVLVRILTEREGPVAEAPLGSDPVVAATTASAVRVRLGALVSREDVAAFRDPAWSDSVARSIYRALGERYSAP